MGDIGSVKAKEPRISVRVDEPLKARIEAVCAKTGIDEADIVRNCIIALCDAVEKNGEITFPLKIAMGKATALIVPPADPGATSRMNEPVKYPPIKRK